MPKPYEQVIFPGERMQADVKIVPKFCKAGEATGKRMVQYTAIDEYSRLKLLNVYDE